MLKSIAIAPSVLSADFSKLGEEIRRVETVADYLHFDVMDGHFVPNLTIGVPVLESVHRITTLPITAHLMISNPLDMIEPFAKAGADIIEFHAEATKDYDSCIEAIKANGKKAGIAINPDTPISKIEGVLSKVDIVLVMSVFPGFAGQSFIDVTPKIKELRKKFRGLIEVDGGITTKTAPSVIKAGADILVAGSFVFKAENPAQAVKDLRKCST